MAKRLGELLVDAGLVDQDTIREALRIQAGGGRRLGSILIRMGRLDEDRLLGVLAEQLDLPIVTVADEFSETVRTVLPRYLCRKYELIPLSWKSQRVLRVAMMNPMDDVAVAVVEEYTGAVVMPELARRSDITAAIERHIPWTWRELGNPEWFTPRKIAVAALLVVLLAGGAGLYLYRQQRYGQVVRHADRVTYKNFDLTVEYFPAEHKVGLRGRGARSDGFFMVTFPEAAGLDRFLAAKETQFSAAERRWLDWVLSQVGVARPAATAPQQ